jgi:peptide/nickel transport system permease protein
VDPFMIAASLIAAVALLWALAPAWFAPFAPTDMDPRAILQAPSRVHLLGSDHMGRDVLSLIIYGAHQSIMVGVGSAVISLSLGGIVGLFAGYFGGAADMVIMRLIDVWLSVPATLLLIIIATALRPSLGNVILTIGLVSAPHFARVMRSQVVSIKSRPFVEASRSIGGSHLSIVLRHILPHTLSQVLVTLTLSIAVGMLMGAMMSFLGLGVVQDRPDWGFLLNQGRSYLTTAWWFATFPGLAITVLVIALNILGEALRRRLDPRGKPA